MFQNPIKLPATIAAPLRPKQRDVLVWFGMALVATWLLWTLPVSNDVSYQYWLGRQLRVGADFGHDIVEVNPPLWFWEAALLSALSDVLGIASAPAMIAAMMLRTALAVTLTSACMTEWPRQRRIAAGAGLMAMVVILAVRDMGQREHIMLLGALPYAALAARRREQKPTGALLACAVGVFAAYGIALKPHFLVIPLVLEGWLAWHLRGRYRPLRPECAAAAVLLIVYAAAVPVFAPGYLRESLGLASRTYGTFGPPLSALIVQPYAPAWIIAATILLTRWRRLGAAPQTMGMLGLACAVSYGLQGKAFSYHAMPITAALLAAVWLAICEGRAIKPGALRVASGTVIAATCAMAWMIGAYRADDLGAISKRLKALPAGSSFAVISAHSWDAFPFVEDQRLLWPLRTASLWTVPAIVQRGDANLRNTTLRMLADDLACRPPRAILIDNAERAPDTAGRGFDYAAFAKSDTQIAALLTHYRTVARFNGLSLLESEAPPPGVGRCRTIAIRPDYSR